MNNLFNDLNGWTITNEGGNWYVHGPSDRKEEPETKNETYISVTTNASQGCTEIDQKTTKTELSWSIFGNMLAGPRFLVSDIQWKDWVAGSEINTDSDGGSFATYISDSPNFQTIIELDRISSIKGVGQKLKTELEKKFHRGVSKFKFIYLPVEEFTVEETFDND
jgi:hypothetical protein